VLTRRQLLSGATAVCAVSAFVDFSLARTQDSSLRVNSQRLRQYLEGLSVFGRPAGGSFADGVSRIAYSDADIAGRKYAIDLMRAAGLQTLIDAAGNIFGSSNGSDLSLPPILFGSHIDSVPNGGNFDGDVGSMSAIEVVRTLREHGVTTRHPLRVAIWSNEENEVGSAAAAGALHQDALTRITNGFRVDEGIRKIAGDPARLSEAILAPGSFCCYLELHVEQGATLEKENIPIGVVEGIVCIDEFEVEIRGFANHAGTTPMAERHNALLSAAKLIEAVQDVVTSEPGRQVGTVGQLQVFPNASNVVPGLVKHSIELRDLSADKVVRLAEQIRQRAQRIARETSTEILIKQVEHNPPATATPEIQTTIEQVAAVLGLKTMRLPSGAGHDAQWMARLGPMGMIFVPSIGGISHSPQELSSWQACADGANVLLQTILRIDATST